MIMDDNMIYFLHIALVSVDVALTFRIKRDGHSMSHRESQLLEKCGHCRIELFVTYYLISVLQILLIHKCQCSEK